ncbi:hypothetical protein [Streptomyces sp. NPDC047315]|uniref:hypothetical protein n=1 Tax=Streptomyces sp. NPDC047315 TaxID=3155142 RepID=UPI0033F0AFB0
MPTYERGSGPHIAERVQPVPGSEEAERYAALAADPASGWRRADEPAELKTKRAPRKSGGGSGAGGQ